jgi:chromosome partitioning protein
MILCFAAHKGGVGKTTSSINLAAGMARSGKPTLLVDLDPQGHSSIGVGLDLSYDDASIADALGDRMMSLAKIVQPTPVPHLSVAPSTLRLAAMAESLYAKVKREERLSRALRQSASVYEWIVIDCPPALGVLTANALNAADVIIIPCQMGARALDGLEDLLDLLHLLKGEDFDRWHILLTMYDPRKTVTLEIFAEMLKPYAANVLATKIHSSEALNQAQMARQDIYAFDPRSRGALHYTQLTRELLSIGGTT